MIDNVRRCDSCESPLTQMSRRDRRYCSAACRQSAYERRRGSRPARVVTPTEQSEIARVLALATREERLLALVAHASKTNWRAAAWILERRWPERWGRQPRSRPVEVPPSEGDDLFREIDELARKRRERLR